MRHSASTRRTVSPDRVVDHVGAATAGQRRRHDFRWRTVHEASRRGPARARLHTAPGRVERGFWCPGVDLLEGRPRQAQCLAGPAPRRPAPQAVGRPSGARCVFEVQSQQPGNFSLHVHDRCARCSCSRRATFASSARTFASSGWAHDNFVREFIRWPSVAPRSG